MFAKEREFFLKGKIYSLVGGIYHINDSENNMHYLPAAGVFRHKEISPIVGDYVEFEENKYISKIYERKNFFIRPKVANIDIMVVVMSIKEPNFSTYLIDKYLAFIESSNVEPVILITKNDLGCNQAIEQYKKIGYKVVLSNFKTREWVKNIKSIFNYKTCTLMGQSGVGKTTIFNILTNNNFETQGISKNANRGKHTTRVVQIFKILNGELIDTPGFSNLKLNLDKYQMAKAFKQFKKLSTLCKFKSCLHENEPEELCNIKLSVKNGTIPKFRYQNYLKLLEEVKNA